MSRKQTQRYQQEDHRKLLSANRLCLKRIKKEILCRLLQNQTAVDRTRVLLKDLEMTCCCKCKIYLQKKFIQILINIFSFRADYVAWNGANPDIIGKCRIKSNGPNQFLRSERTYIPRGSSSKLCKGPQSGLAIGSIYAQTSHPANVACN